MSEDRTIGRGFENYPVGTRIRGRVSAVLERGVLVTIADGVDGLIAFADPSFKIVNPAKILEVGDEVEAIVSELDMDQRRVSLSLRRIINP